jgi:hypothetical protein
VKYFGKFSVHQTAAIKYAKKCFGELLLDGSRATDFAFDAAGEKNFRQLLVPQDVRDQSVCTREAPGARSWRLRKNLSRQQTANVNEY